MLIGLRVVFNYREKPITRKYRSSLWKIWFRLLLRDEEWNYGHTRILIHFRAGNNMQHNNTKCSEYFTRENFSLIRLYKNSSKNNQKIKITKAHSCINNYGISIYTKAELCLCIVNLNFRFYNSPWTIK